MPDDHDVGSKAEFVTWIDTRLDQLATDDKELPATTGHQYFYIFDDAEVIAAKLGLGDVIEAMGVRPPVYAMGGNQAYLSGVRAQIRTKLLRIRPLLIDDSSSSVGRKDIPLDDTTLAIARANLAHVQALALVNTTVESWLYPPIDVTPPGADAVQPPLILNGPGKSLTVRGKPKDKVTDPQYNVLQALFDAGGRGLNKDELVKNSGHGDAVRILGRIADIDDDWKSVIGLAGKPGGRYRILDLH